jgi:hypothetical protein
MYYIGMGLKCYLRHWKQIPYLLLGAMRPVLHVEGSRSRPGIIVVRRSHSYCPFFFHFGFTPVVCLKTVSILHLLVSLKTFRSC